ncbi:MAG: hypothetical protein M1472_04665 [Planctomycetes bacterium]|nr:hypothetical protein [Planctomycetota bacterium]
MSTKFSIVTSAADGCGKPSSIRSMDNLPSRDHKGAEYKESFMLSNRSSISRGFSPATAALMAVIASLGIAAYGSIAGATSISMTPVAATGWNQKIIVENTAVLNGTDGAGLIGAAPGTADSGYAGYITVTQDGGIYNGAAYYQQGLAGSPSGTGLPTSGSFVSKADGTTTFQFQPYNADNVLFLSDNIPSSSPRPTGTLTLTNPSQFNELAVLAITGSATAFSTGAVTLNLTDPSGNSVAVTTDYAAPDWFSGGMTVTPDGNATGIAISGFNRINNVQNGTFDTAYLNNQPVFYQTTLDLANLTGTINGTMQSGLNLTGDTLNSLFFNDAAQPNSSGSTGIYAISGSAIPEPAVLALFAASGLALLVIQRRRGRA